MSYFKNSYNNTKWNGKQRLVVTEKYNFMSLLAICQYSTGLDIHNNITPKAFHPMVVQTAGEAHRMSKQIIKMTDQPIPSQPSNFH